MVACARVERLRGTAWTSPRYSALICCGCYYAVSTDESMLMQTAPFIRHRVCVDPRNPHWTPRPREAGLQLSHVRDASTKSGRSLHEDGKLPWINFRISLKQMLQNTQIHTIHIVKVVTLQTLTNCALISSSRRASVFASRLPDDDETIHYPTLVSASTSHHWCHRFPTFVILPNYISRITMSHLCVA
jgi:hypothetical protein